jgi:NADH-quinone oxidoreductase subunit F
MQILKKTNLKAFEKAKKLGPKGVIKLIKEKGLAGRGGAGFPTGTKWEMVRNAEADEKYVICNADEGEPGTFKDRMIIEENPETLVEGILIAAYAVGAKKAFVYLRGEYTCFRNKLNKKIKQVLSNAKSDLEIEIFVGAGAYVCGEETAILASVEGKRGHPKVRPPYPTTYGLFGKPTVINNVETLANVPLAMMLDGWDKDMRLHCISGDVEKPGVYEAPLGEKLFQAIERAKPKNKPKAVYFGCFGGCMPYEKFRDMELRPEKVCEGECMLGSCTLIVADETRSIVDVATNVAKFYEFESCGKCTPCREGTMRVLAMLQNISVGDAKMEDLDTLQELAEVIKETSFCGLGQTATSHVINALKFFRKDFEDRIKK